MCRAVMLLTADEPTEALMAFLSKRAGVLARGIFEVSILCFSLLDYYSSSFYHPTCRHFCLLSYHISCPLFCHLRIFDLVSFPVPPLVSFPVSPFVSFSVIIQAPTFGYNIQLRISIVFYTARP